MTFVNKVIAGRREREQIDEARDAELAAGQRAYLAREAEREAEYQRRRGPQTPREELDRQASERDREIAALRGLLEEVGQERQRLSGEIVEAASAGELERALAAQIRLAALPGVQNTVGLRLRQLGLDADGRGRPMIGLR